jgi:bacterial/archaeal transporter family-2 protein
MEQIAVPGLLLVGGLLALQAAANVQLSAAIGSPFAASTLQLLIGAALLVVAALPLGALAALGPLDDVEPWHLVGGVGSAVYITAGILLFPRLGAVVAVGLFIAGQMLASLLLDGFGWLGVDREPLDAAAALGAVAVVAGGYLIVRAQAGAGALEGAARRSRGWLALGLAAGAVLPVQGAINAQLRGDLDEPLAVGAVSFAVATIAMAVALIVALSVSRVPRPRLEGLGGLPWWGWLGGLVGASYVTSVFVAIPEMGAAATIALTVAGQQVASVLVDRHGLLRLPRRPISASRLTGVVVLLAGVVLIQVA